MSKGAKKTLLTVGGGLAIIAATILLPSFFSSPPSRAEFSTFKAETELKEKAIGEQLTELKDGQTIIQNDIKDILKKL